VPPPPLSLLFPAAQQEIHYIGWGRLSPSVPLPYSILRASSYPFYFLVVLILPPTTKLLPLAFVLLNNLFFVLAITFRTILPLNGTQKDRWSDAIFHLLSASQPHPRHQHHTSNDPHLESARQVKPLGFSQDYETSQLRLALALSTSASSFRFIMLFAVAYDPHHRHQYQSHETKISEFNNSIILPVSSCSLLFHGLFVLSDFI